MDIRFIVSCWFCTRFQFSEFSDSHILLAGFAGAGIICLQSESNNICSKEKVQVVVL